MIKRIIAAILFGALAPFSATLPAVAECEGPDFAVTALTIQEIESAGPNRFDFEITCQISNTGKTDYVSEERGQAVYLMKLTTADEGEQRLRYRRFAELAVGESLQVSRWLLDWNVTEKPEPVLMCWVQRQIEVNREGDPANWDCDPYNNRMVLPGEGINALLTQKPLATPPIHR